MQSFWKLLEDAYGADYYAFCDQDDVWLPKKVERGVFALEKEKIQKVKISYPRICHCYIFLIFTDAMKILT